eukprot:3431632-Rhodomonas_salina.1
MAGTEIGYAATGCAVLFVSAATGTEIGYAPTGARRRTDGAYLRPLDPQGRFNCFALRAPYKVYRDRHFAFDLAHGGINCFALRAPYKVY